MYGINVPPSVGYEIPELSDIYPCGDCPSEGSGDYPRVMACS